METSAGSHTDESTQTCVICLSSITERAIAAPCDHYTFDFICLVSWLQQRSTCPLCKAEVSAVQYDWRSPTDYKQYSVRRTQPTHLTTVPSLGSSLHHDPHSSSPRPLRTRRRPNDRPQLDVPLLRRRHVYRRKLYSLYVGSNAFSGYRDLTPQMIAHSPELQSRAKSFIRRELRVFTFLHTDPTGNPSSASTTSSNAEYLLSYILATLKKVGFKESDGHAEELLSEFLGRDNARLFLHELESWLRSPYNRLQEWDCEVQYAEALPDQFDTRGMPLWQGKTNCGSEPGSSRPDSTEGGR